MVEHHRAVGGDTAFALAAGAREEGDAWMQDALIPEFATSR